jgi:hypothetical protein
MAAGHITRRGRAVLCALLTSLLAPAAAAAPVQPSQQQISEYERVDETTRVKLLMHLARSGQQDLAAHLLERYPLTGRHAANRTLFIEGLILKANGDLTGAAKKFRAALADDPKLTLVRAELAQTLVTLEQDDSATHHLKLLAADAPSEQDAAGIRAFVDRIDERRPYKFNAYVAVAPSSNVNSGSSHSTVYSPLFGSNLSIGDDGRKKSGIGVATGANAAFNKRLGNDFSFVAAANAEVRVYDDSDFNSISLSQSAELRYLLERGYLGFGAVSSQSLDDRTLDPGYVSYGPRLSTRLNITAKDTLTASTTYEWRDYSSGSAMDGTAWMSDVAWTHAFAADTNVTLTGGHDDVNLDMKQASYDSWSAGLGLYRELPLGITASLNGEVKFSEFDDVNLLAGVIRDDTRYVAGIGLTKRDLNLFGFAPELAYTYIRNDSNITMYDYDSHAVDVRLTRDF